MRMGRPPMTAAELHFREQFAEQLTEDLKTRGMTQKELADRLGVPATTVNQWCKGSRVPTLFRWWQLQKAFKEVDA